MKLCHTVSLLLCFSFSQAQNITGYWYGSASVAGSASQNNYLTELILKQNGTSVKGVLNYYFRDSYRSTSVSGLYNPATRKLSLFDLRLPFVGSNTHMEVDCPMDLNGLLQVAKAASELKGSFTSRSGYQYTCPDLVFDLKRNEGESPDSVLTAIKNFKETKQLWRPSGTDTLVTAVVIQRKIENIVVNREFEERSLEVEKEIEVTSDSLQVAFYDNGEVDGDSISIFFNRQLLAANVKLSDKAIQLTLKLDTTKEANYIAMFANNLGSIPPNTALMIIYDGTKRYELSLLSDLSKTGTVKITRKRPPAK